MFLKKIKDIQIIDGNIAVFRNVDLRVKDLESQISRLNFTGNNKSKNPLVENALLPPFIQVFYYLFYKNIRIPTEDEFLDTYFDWVCESNSEKNVLINKVEYPKVDVKARLLRTYPSLIRDVHFYYLLLESGYFSKVEYSLHTDYFDGLDLKITHENIVYYLSVFIKTSRGIEFKIKKSNRHNYDSVNEVQLGVNFNSLHQIGDIFLLNSSHITTLIELLKNKVNVNG